MGSSLCSVLFRFALFCSCFARFWHALFCFVRSVVHATLVPSRVYWTISVTCSDWSPQARLTDGSSVWKPLRSVDNQDPLHLSSVFIRKFLTLILLQFYGDNGAMDQPFSVCHFEGNRFVLMKHIRTAMRKNGPGNLISCFNLPILLLSACFWRK